MTRPTCATCRAFVRSSPKSGQCCARPPRPDSEWNACWPWVNPDNDWCLEHIEKLDPDKLPDVMRG